MYLIELEGAHALLFVVDALFTVGSDADVPALNIHLHKDLKNVTINHRQPSLPPSVSLLAFNSLTRLSVILSA